MFACNEIYFSIWKILITCRHFVYISEAQGDFLLHFSQYFIRIHTEWELMPESLVTQVLLIFSMAHQWPESIHKNFLLLFLRDYIFLCAKDSTNTFQWWGKKKRWVWLPSVIPTFRMLIEEDCCNSERSPWGLPRATSETLSQNKSNK